MNTNRFYSLLPVIVILCIWQWSASTLELPYLPSLTNVYEALVYHYTQGNLVSDIQATLYRVCWSFIIAMLLGCVLGVLLGRFQWLNTLSDPILLFFLNLPALVVIILCYIWIGLIEAAAVTAVVINKMPLVIVNLREGARVVDQSIMQLGSVYQLPRTRIFWQLYLPQLYPFILSAARGGLSLIWKIVLVVELLGRSEGVGFALHGLFQYFDIAGILAYSFSFMLLVFLFDVFVLRRLDNLIQRGRS